MRHLAMNLRCALAGIVVTGASMGTALAQDPPADPDQTVSCEPPGSCPGQAQPTQQPAQAQQPAPEQQQPATAYSDLSTYGLALTGGGGVTDWFHTQMRNVAGVAGTWDVRLFVGLNSPIGLEVAYVGQAGSLNPSFGPAVNTTLVSNGAEGSIRLNVFHDLPFQPFLVAGLAWNHWTASNVNFADFGVNTSDNTISVPLGFGLAYKASMGLYADARITLRPNIGDGIVVAQPIVVNGTTAINTQFVDMSNWNASARIGYAF